MPHDDATAESPCVRNCCLDSADVCVGCGRNLDEILHWRQSEPGWRQVVLRVARERLVARRRRSP